MATLSSSSVPQVTPPKPAPTTTDSTQTPTPSTDTDNPLHQVDSSGSDSGRPRLGPRMSSGTMIVPADHPEVEIKSETYPPNDARSFSPRRSAEETERMVDRKRNLLQSHASELQSGLDAIVEKVEHVKSDHDKLERNNTALQDYIGGLTQSMSRTNLTTGGGGSGRKK